MPLNIGDNRIVEDQIARTSVENVERLSRHKIQVGDIIYSRRGDIERRALIREHEVGWLCGTGCLLVRPDTSTVNPEWLSFWLGTEEIRRYIVRHAVGATMLNLNTGILASVPVDLPSLENQRAIARILTSLDDKIELNRRMNATLEEMARALFQSWFVDFDPVKLKASGGDPVEELGLAPEIVALFPDSFEDSEIGPMPSGWLSQTLNELGVKLLGGDWGKDSQTPLEAEEVRCIRGADIPSLQNFGYGKMPIRYIKASSAEKRSLRPGTIVVEISGGSPTQSTGRAVLATSDWLQGMQTPVVASNFCRAITAKSEAEAVWLYFALRRLYDQNVFLNYENGTTGIKNLAFSKFCDEYLFVCPEDVLISSYMSVVSPLLQLMNANTREAGGLAETRDYLLPRLLSGEVAVGDGGAL